ncbi:phosphomannomutase/phosphoglucomutase [Acinetobacter calcoaceticus]|uniref:phosphomannomutase n=1 Tax=Acinetobacter calcoaceticus TaxID=471 RepID=A0A4R1XV88_ACICA|nr:phosphomannomutase/phosphoglucomutase [Acinetobacter calcoaceticus]
MNIQPNNFPYQIFRAYDIRGEVNFLDAHLINAIACAFVQKFQLKGQTQVVLGYDARLTSPTYAQIIKQVLTEYFEVIEIGCCSTPQLYFAAHQYQGNGIMVTASHNPKSDNGIKWIIQGDPPTPESIQYIATLAERYYQRQQILESLPLRPPQYHTDSFFAYTTALLSDIQLKRPLKVVVDGLNGSAGQSAQYVLKKLNCELISLRCDANGHFPDHSPDPSQAIHLQQLRQQVLAHSADIGIALDGDGDRVVLVDEQANIISADRLLALLAQICLAQNPAGEIVYDVKCSTLVRQSIEALGGKAKMIRTGSSFLRRYISKSKGEAILGGEYAGHYVFNDGRGFGFDDGLYAALRVLEYISEYPNLTFSDILSAYPERFHTEDTYISTHNTHPATVLNEIANSSQQFNAQLSEIDGVRLDFDHGFGIIRASNTGDFFTVRFDADTLSNLNKIRHTFVSMLSDHYPMIAQDILNAH